MSGSAALTLASFNINLQILQIERAIPHEETIQEITDSLVAEILRDNLQVDPVVLDAKSSVVLDGMHRIAALKSLGCKQAVVCSIDYSNPAVRVYRWARCISTIKSIVSELREKLELSKARASAAIELVDRGDAPVSLITIENAYVSRKKFNSVEDAYFLVREFDRVLYGRGLRFASIPDNIALSALGAPYAAVLYAAPPKKEDVLHSAISRKLFPAKSTRHFIPVRPVGIMYPLQDLMHLSRKEAQTTLDRMLKSSTPLKLPAGSNYRGRSYEEVLIQIRGQ